VLVAVVCVFNLWYLRAERDPVADLNDGTFHAAYVRWAADRISQGHSPFDGLFTPLGLGFPIFHHYQVLPHILSGAAGTVIGADTAYRWALYLLLALWPIAIYASARLFGFARSAAACAGVVSPFLMSLPGYGLEQGSFLWRGYGMWSLLWGMWFFPFALALAWRALDQRRSLALAALLLAATITSHALTGYLALVVVVAFAFVASGPWRKRVARAVLIVAGALAASAWLLVPTLRDRAWTRNSLPSGTFWTDSYGAKKVLGWLVRGELLDHGRWPVVTVLAAVGLAVTIWEARTSRLSRALLALTVVSLVLFFGRPTLGPLVNLLPIQDELFLPRMIVGVHLGAILLAGVGLAALGRGVVTLVRRLPRTVHPMVIGTGALVGIVLVLAPAWTQLRDYDDTDATWISQQHQADATQGADFAALVELARAGGGRIYAGLPTNWGAQFLIGYVPAVEQLTNLDADGIGFTGRVPALTEPSEGRFDDTNPANYQLFDVRWVIEPDSRPAPPTGALVATRGHDRLYSVPTGGLMQVVDTTPAITTTSQGIDVAVDAFLHSDLPSQARYPLLALNGRDPGSPTLPGGSAEPSGLPGAVSLAYGSVDGVVGGVVTATRPAAVVLKMSAHPRWHATVDGEPARVRVVAPGFMAVDVPAGTHRVEFTYEAVSGAETVGWFALGAIALGGLWMLDRRLSRSRRRASSRSAPSTEGSQTWPETDRAGSPEPSASGPLPPDPT
jgi:hypothetical protein